MLFTHQVTCNRDSSAIAVMMGGKVYFMDCNFRNAFFEKCLKSVALCAVNSLHKQEIYTC